MSRRQGYYFSKHPSRSLIGLYWSAGIMNLAVAAISLFEPVFLFSLGYGLVKIVFFYLLVYSLYVLILPPVGRLIGKIGFEHSIFYSQFFLAAFYISLFSISYFPWLFYIAPCLLAIQKALYWPAYHADFSLFSNDRQRGREIGGLETLSLIVFVAGPLIGGLILERGGFNLLFIVVSVMFIVSAIPLLKIKEIHSKADFSYGRVFRGLLDSAHRRNFMAYLGFGEEMIVMTVWPIFIYLVVRDYLEMGAIIAAATLLTGALVLYLGRLTDRYSKKKLLNAGSLVYFLSWLVRGFVGLPWQVVGVDTLSRVAKESLFVPLEAMTYETAKKVGPLEYGVFFEQSLAVGKVFAAAVVIIIIYFIPDPWLIIFIAAGLFSLLYILFRPRP